MRAMFRAQLVAEDDGLTYRDTVSMCRDQHGGYYTVATLSPHMWDVIRRNGKLWLQTPATNGNFVACRVHRLNMTSRRSGELYLDRE